MSFDSLVDALKQFHTNELLQKDLEITRLLSERTQAARRQSRSDRQILKLAKQVNFLKQKLMRSKANAHNTLSPRPENVLIEKLTAENHALFKKIGAEREGFENRISQLKMEFNNRVSLGNAYYDNELVDGKMMGIRDQGPELNGDLSGQDITVLDDQEGSEFSVDLSSNGRKSNQGPSQDLFEENSRIQEVFLEDYKDAGSETPSNSKKEKETMQNNGCPNLDLPLAKPKANYSKTPIAQVSYGQKPSEVVSEQAVFEEIVPNSNERQAKTSAKVLENLSPNKPETEFKRKRDVICLSDSESLIIEENIKPTKESRSIPITKTSQNTRSSLPPRALYSKTPITLTPTPTPTFAYNHVTRDKASRQQMHGDDCPCCSEYYRLTKNLPRLNKAGNGAKQEVSRHRAWFKRPSTPPGYLVSFNIDSGMYIWRQRKRLKKSRG